jgi:uncharacterized protein with LGFP repeats
MHRNRSTSTSRSPRTTPRLRAALTVTATAALLATIGPGTATARPIGAFDVGGAIETKYDQLGGYGFFGDPSTPESDANGGRFQAFERGASIYWSLGAGAHQIGGLIRDKWGSLGWESGPLGFPITDEAAAGADSGGSTGSSSGSANSAASGRYNLFPGGAIYWSQSAGAHAVWGAIRDSWVGSGAENGQYGYPTSDEYNYGTNGKAQDFQKGRITWTP